MNRPICFSRTPRWLLPVALVSSAVIVRALFWYLLRELPPSSDWNAFYNPSAVILANSGNLLRPDNGLEIAPGYVIFLAAAYKLLGFGMATMRASQILIDGLVVLCTFIIGERVFSRKVAAIGAFAYAFYPPAIYMSGLGQPESVLTLCLVLLVLAWLHSRQIQSYRSYVGLGALLGVALLLKPNYLGFLPFWAIADLVVIRDGRRGVLNIACALLGALLIAASWNMLRSGSGDPTASSSVYGKIVYMGSLLRPGLPDGSLQPLGYFYSNEMQRLEQQLGISNPTIPDLIRPTVNNWLLLVWPNPTRLITFLMTKFTQIWYATDSGTLDKYLRWAQLPLAVLTFAGLVVAKLQRQLLVKQWLPALLLLYTMGALLVITPLLREFMPVVPIVLLFASSALLAIQQMQKGRSP